ncbi:hypothetical protein ABPG77_007951 [Micractinium sp. CCAP 211/92]
MLKHEDHCRQARKELDALYKPPKALLSAAVPATRLWGMPEGWEHYAEAAQAVAVQYGTTLHTLTYDWQRAYFTDGSVQKSDEGAHLVGAAVWRATGGTGAGSTAWRINPNGYGPTNTINCAEGAAVWTVLWHILEEDEHADIFTDSHKLPCSSVRGFRAPGFRTHDAVGRVLADLGFKYDSSHMERSYQQQGGALDAGFELTLARLDVPHNWSGLPLFAVLAGGNKRMDPLPAAGMSILQRLQADFERKRGSGVPVPILAHIAYLNTPSNRGEVVEFLRWALAQPNTWALTYSQYVAWLEAGPAVEMTRLLADHTCDHS